MRHKNGNFKLNRLAKAVIMATTAMAAIPLAHANGGGYGLGSDGVTPVQTFYANTYIHNDGADGTTNTVRGLKKFVDTLPGVTAPGGAAGSGVFGGANNLGQYIPLAVPDKASYPGADYYEIAVVEFTERMHSELAKPTTLRGYVQIDRAMTNAAGSVNAAQVTAYNNYVLALNAYNAKVAAYNSFQAQNAAYLAAQSGLQAAQATYTGTGVLDASGNPADWTAYSTALSAFNASVATYNSQLTAANQYSAAVAGQASTNQLLSNCAFLTANGFAYLCANQTGWPAGATMSVSGGVWTVTGFTYGYASATGAALVASYGILQPGATGNAGTNSSTTAPIVDLPFAAAPTVPALPATPLAPPVPTYTYTDPVTSASVTTAYLANLSTGVLSGPVQPATVNAPGAAPTPVSPPVVTGGTVTPSVGSMGVPLFNPDGITPLMVYKEVGDPGNTGKWNHALYTDPTTGSPVLVQAYGYDKPHYMGPLVDAQRGTAVRVKYVNALPAGRAVTNPDGSVTRNGDLFLPVDETLTGAGYGPDGVTMYTQNRSDPHWHGGDTPWISDGTPHQWLVPAGDEPALAGISVGGVNAHMARGASQQNVPDMPDPGLGAETLYWPNNMSGRLMFYHDHTVALTRLNVYAGMAAGYLLEDPVEKALNQPSGTLTAFTASAMQGTPAASVPGVGLPTAEIPLVIQDKTFVPNDIAQEDARWDVKHWGTEGDLWFPHVYETNQNPGGAADGTNPVGRWDYGPWFWPVYAAPLQLPTGVYGDVTTTPEGFMDTPIINGTAYPTMTVEPKAYRLRILNASNDRMLNLGLYVADGSVTTADGRTNTEVKMVPFFGPNGPTATTYACPDGVTAGQTVGTVNANGTITKAGWTESGANNKGTVLYPVSFPCTGGLQGTGWGNPDARPGGVPDPATAGPDIVQIGNEGGLLPNPVVIPSTPVNYEYNKRSVTVLNVFERGLFIGSAERADVVIDFSKYAGKTLILYNDSPAPLPAGDPRIDYFTGVGDQTASGGALDTVAGFGPNTRTMMQIVVGTATTGTPTAFNLGSPAVPATPTSAAVPATGLFDALPKAYYATQDAPYVSESAYNNAYGTSNADSYATIFAGSSIQPNFVFTPTTATAQVLQSVSLTGQGVGYTVAPMVVFSGGGLTAPVTLAPVAGTQGAQVAGGKVTSILLPSGFALTGLVTAPTVSIVSNPDPATGVSAAGTGASAMALTNQSISTPVKNKAIQELFDTSYGRMNATHGVELPFTSLLNQTTIPLGYLDQPTENIADGQIQIWKITHNGVDSHPVHFHLFNLQVINRVGWDGTIKPPYDNEQGWKETVKMNPLEDIYVAVKPRSPKIPFGIPESNRLMDPSQPVGAITGFTQVDPLTGAAPIDPTTGATVTYTNQITNYGWEYVWHCHILGHEENDFMRPMTFAFGALAPATPTGLSASGTASSTAAFPVSLAWTDPTPAAAATTAGNKQNEIGFKVYRAPSGTSTYSLVGTTLANATSFTDTAPPTASGYLYQVTAFNSAGESAGAGASVGAAAAAPAPLAATSLSAPAAGLVYNSVGLQWKDNSGSTAANASAAAKVAESGFAIWRAAGACTGTSAASMTGFTQVGTAAAHAGTSTGNTPGATWPTFADTTVAANTTYCYKVVTMNGATAAANPQPVVSATTPAAPNLAGLTAPSNLTVQLVTPTTAQATFTDLATAEDVYLVQVSTDSGKSWGDGTNTTATQVAPAYVATLTRAGAAKTGSGTAVTIPISNTNWVPAVGGTPYIFRVAAASGTAAKVTGQGAWSNTDTIDLSGTTVIAPAGGFTAVQSPGSTTSVNLSWTDAANNNSTYNVQYSTDGGKTWSANLGTTGNGVRLAAAPNGISTSAQVIGLSAATGTTASGYTFRIQAQSLGVNASNWVSSATVSMVAAPATPAGLAFAANGVTSTSLALNWTASTGAASYSVQYSTSATFATSTTVSVTGTSTTLSGLSPNTRYYVRVASVNAVGTSAYSTAINQLLLPAVPGTPTGSPTSATAVTVSWTASTGGTTSYTLQYSTDGTFATGVTSVAGLTTTSRSVTGLVSGSTYYFRVQAVNATGGSGYSASLTQVMPVIPAVPASPSATAVTAAGLTLNWTAVTGAASYTVQRATNAAFTAGLNTTTGVTTNSLAVAGLNANTTYWFRVLATNVAGSSAFGTGASQLTLPTAPGGVGAANGAIGTPVTAGLNWTAVAGLTYNVMWGTAAQLNANTGTLVTGVTSGQQLAGMAAGTVVMKVQAVNATGAGAWSANTNVTAR